MNPQRIVILGGGTAGWMAANLLAHRWREHPIHITVVESPDIGIIGVGATNSSRALAHLPSASSMAC